MVKRKGHKKTRRVKHNIPLRLARMALERGSSKAKKHITKENIKKAIAASKAATSKLKALLKRKKANGGQRITMSIFKR